MKADFGYGEDLVLTGDSQAEKSFDIDRYSVVDRQHGAFGNRGIRFTRQSVPYM